MTKSRVFLWAMVAFVAGVAVRSFAVMPYVLLGVALCIVGVGITVGFLRSRRNMILGGCFLLVFLSGIIRFDVVQRSAPDLSRLYWRSFTVRGLVVRDPSFTDAAQRLKIKVKSLDTGTAASQFFVLATARKYPAYAIGDELKIAGVIGQPENFSNFDYVSYLARDGTFAVMSFPRIEKIGEGKGNRLILILSRIKHQFEKNIDAALPEPHAAFMKGLLLGERSSLPRSVRNDFQAAGVSHIVALSGYNITIVGRSIIDMLLFFTVPFAVSCWSAAVAIILFVLLTGAAASVVRAGIMGVLVLLALKEGKPYHMTNALAFAGAAMIFHNPFILRFDAGFQLSFLATAGLVYLSPHVERILDRLRAKFGARYQWEEERQRARTKRVQWMQVRQSLVETLSAQIMVLPLLILLFGRVSLISPLANLAVLIAVPYSMGVGFAAGAVGFLSETLREIVGWGAWVLLEYQLRAISFFARMPFASIEVGAWAAGPLLIVYGIIFWRIWRKSKNTER